MGKEIWLPIDPRILVLTTAYVHPPVRTVSGGGRGGGGGGGGGEFQGNPTGGGEGHLFLTGSRMTIVAFEEEVSLKA